MSWGTTFCPPIGPSVRQSLLIWIKAKGPHCVLLFLVAKIVTPQSARGRGFAEIIPPPLWGGDQSPNAMRPRGAMGGVHDVPINETSPPEYTPLWGRPMWAIELNHP